MVEPQPANGLNAEEPSGFVYLGKELSRRTLAPVRHFTFWFYLVFGVLLFGGAGVELELLRYHYAAEGADAASILTAFVTFFPALIGSASLQLVFQDTIKPLRAFSIGVIVLSLILASWLTLDRTITKSTALLVAVPICVIAVWIWWLANAEDPTFRDLLDVAAPVGGNPSRELEGKLTGFKH